MTSELWNPQDTPNFTKAELACKCGQCGGRADMQAFTMNRLQKMREVIGEPLIITSGFRCSDHPEERKKARPGAHGQGKAVDVACGDSRLRYMLVSTAPDLGFTGIGISDGFIHLDTGHDHAYRPTCWTY